VEEPDLGENEGGGDEAGGDEAGAAREQEHQGNEPDDVLRGDEAVEGKEARDGRRRGENEALGAPRLAQVQEPDREDRGDLEHRGHGRERVGK
jgi:hypothetical protein